MAAALAASTFGAATAQAAPATSTTVKYLAVGDSYPAGWGVGSNQAYPALLGAVNYALVMDVNKGVAGATTSAVPGQLGSPQPNSIVTVTVGSNDLQWDKVLLGQVPAPGPGDFYTLGVKIANVVGIAQSNNVGATILVTGYPHVFGNLQTTCDVGGRVQVDPAKASGVNGLVDGLNAAIAGGVDVAVANGANAKYVDIVPAFTGHGLCGGNPWLFDLDDPSTLPPGAAAFHPNARGQKAYAQVIQQNGFQKAALNVSRG